MKHLKPNIQKEGFRLSREWLNFNAASIADVESAVAKLYRQSSPIFINGGISSFQEDPDRIIMSSGIVAYQGKLYEFEGGEFLGTKYEYSINFEEVESTDYPKQDYATDIGNLDSVFLKRRAYLSKESSDISESFLSIGRYNLTTLSNKIAVATSGGHYKISDSAISVATSGVTLLEDSNIGYGFLADRKRIDLSMYLRLNTSSFTGRQIVIEIDESHSIRLNPRHSGPFELFSGNILYGGSAFNVLPVTFMIGTTSNTISIISTDNFPQFNGLVASMRSIITQKDE